MGNAASAPVVVDYRQGGGRRAAGGGGAVHGTTTTSAPPLPRPSLTSQPTTHRTSYASNSQQHRRSHGSSNGNHNMNKNVGGVVVPAPRGRQAAAGAAATRALAAAGGGGPSSRRPPPQLNSNEPFLVISPASDVSNPSNFHHLKRRTQQTPVRDRRRASKVFHTQPAENHNNNNHSSSFVISRPHNFYVTNESYVTGASNDGIGDHGHPVELKKTTVAAAAPLLRGFNGIDDDVDNVLQHRPGTLQRVKQALVGCLQDVILNPTVAGGRSAPNDHPYGGGHIQLVSTQSTLSPVDDDNHQHRLRYSDGLLHDSDNPVQPPDTAGFIRHKPVDPNIPSSVECNFRASGQMMMNAMEDALPRHPFASILESADEASGGASSDPPGPTTTTTTTQGRDSPVCLLFADEANHAPNFSTSMAVVRRDQVTTQAPEPNHHRNNNVVDESAYLNEHPSAVLDEPSHLLQVSGHEAFRMASTSFGVGAHHHHHLDPDDNVGEDDSMDELTRLQQVRNHNMWLNRVLDIQQQSRNQLYELKKHQKRPSAAAEASSRGGAPGGVVTAPSFATASTSATGTTGPAVLEASKAKDKQQQKNDGVDDEERKRRAVADSVQRQINSKLLQSKSQPPPATRGRSAEPRQRDETGRATTSRGRSIESNSNNESIVQRNRKIFERPPGGRSSSMPPSPAPRAKTVGVSEARKISRNSRSRSSSLPHRRSSAAINAVDNKPPPPLPALLQLAGWQAPPPAAQPKQLPPPKPSSSEADGKPKPLPGLLQLSSSWNTNGGVGGHDKSRPNIHLGPNKRLSDPFPLRRQANLGNLSIPAARQRHSEPLPQQRRLPHTAGSSDMGVRDDSMNTAANRALQQGMSKSKRPSSTSIAVQTSPEMFADSKVPDRPVVNDNSLTIAWMLAQTYPLARVYSDDEEDDDDKEQDVELRGSRSQPNSVSADYMKYTYVAPTQTIAAQSPGVMSVATTDGMSPAPASAVTNEASSNAAFLFKSDDEGHYPINSEKPASRPPPTFSITTLDSLHRVSGLTPFAPRIHPSIGSVTTMPPTPHAVESLTLPPVHDDDRRSSSGAGSHDSIGNRHVRFTESTQKREAFRARSKSGGGDFPVVTTYPNIDSKLSDLTDTNNHQHQQLAPARSFDSAVSSSTHPTIHEDADENEKDDASDAVIADADPKFSTPPELESEESPKESAAKNWAYRQNGAQGVTPYRPGSVSTATNGAASHVTNSPFVRFKEARSKFTATKELPVKRSSPSPKSKWAAKGRDGGRVSGGLVHQRIIAMEAAHNQAANSSPVRAPQPKSLPQRVRRETTGHDAIAPRKSTLVSPLFRPVVPTSEAPMVSAVAPIAAAAMGAVAPAGKRLSRSSIGSQQIHRTRDSTSTAESEYGEIKQATIIDEDSSDGQIPSQQSCPSINNDLSPANQTETRSVVSEEDEEEDAFAALLDESDEDADDEEGEDETVSTILQTRPSVSSGYGKYANFRLSSDSTTPSTASSVSTIKQHRLSFFSSDESTAFSSKQSESLAFRDESLVRPNEQKLPKNAKGRLHLSPMQRTPMQARKWRALAAEAKANNPSKPIGNASIKASSLSERHPNAAQHWR